MNKKYEAYKLDNIILNHNTINELSICDTGIIELEQSLSTGYSWHYTISDSTMLKLEGKEIFNFNRPNIVGGHVQIIWKFKPLQCGECKIHFQCYKSWKIEAFFLEEFIYRVIIK